MLLNLDEPPSDSLLHSLVEPQLRTFRSLEQVFHTYDHAPEGAAERTVQFLYDSARLVLKRQAEIQLRNDLLGAAVKNAKVIVGAGAPTNGADGASNTKRKKGDPNAANKPFANAQTV